MARLRFAAPNCQVRHIFRRAQLPSSPFTEPFGTRSRRVNHMGMLEREPGMRYLGDAGEVGRLIEDCVSSGSRSALLYADNLPGTFFDLSSGQAGAILQKLRT